MEKKVERILLSLFLNSRDENDYLREIAIITIKSILPSKVREGNIVDYRRFYEELKLWSQYGNLRDTRLTNIIKCRKDSYREEDRSIFSRLIPLVLVNKRLDLMEEELVKNMLFTTNNMKDILENLSMAYLLWAYLNRIDLVGEFLKDEIINLNQAEYVEKFSSYYRYDSFRGDKNFTIGFEKEKIKIISLLNGIPTPSYGKLEDILRVLEGGHPKTYYGRVIYDGIRDDFTGSLPKFYLDMTNYSLLLRKSRINPDSLVIENYVLPNIFDYNEGEVFFHSLLNESKVIKKEVINGTLTSLVENKTGKYLFRDRPI